MNFFLRLVMLSALLHIIVLPLSAEVSIDSIFRDHMVLQRNAPLVIWGQASEGERVRVQFAGKTLETKAIRQQWELVFPAMPAGGPYELVAKGSNTVTRTDILLGDVWICAGQSNMRFRMSQSDDAAIALLQSKNPWLRFSDWEGKLNPVNTRYPLTYLEQITAANFYVHKEWVMADSSSVGSFSAVAYYFGQNL